MAHLIPIGNSLGVRIPKTIITQLGLRKDSDLDFKLTDEGLLISPSKPIRRGWAEAFKKSRKEKLLMGDDLSNQFDKDEWKW